MTEEVNQKRQLF